MVISVRDAAKLLNVPENTVFRWVSEGKLPCHRVGEQYCFERRELYDFAIREHLPPVPLVQQEESLPQQETVALALERGGVFQGVRGTTKHEVLHNALSLIRGLDRSTIEPLFELFMAREDIASTGIGDGIAIPHAHGPLIGYVNDPILSLSFLEQPIEYGALDGKPVNALFLLISPSVNSHLRILAKLAYLLRSGHCRDAVLEGTPPETILSLFKETEAAILPTASHV
jgi:nitrogen PTS system EIIA component